MQTRIAAATIQGMKFMTQARDEAAHLAYVYITNSPQNTSQVIFFLIRCSQRARVVILNSQQQILLNWIHSLLTVRRGSRGVVSWTCDPVLALGQTFDSHSWHLFCCNPFGFGINCTLNSFLTAITYNPISFFEEAQAPVAVDDG